MKSPFPGMDPYLEQHWPDVHSGLVIYSRDRLQRRCTSGCNARWRGVGRERVISAYGRIRSEISDEPITQGYIEIVDAASGNRVITVIEFLSPSNKMPGEGQELYLRKRREVIQAGASLVEIDLTRGGTRDLPLPRTVYRVPIARPIGPASGGPGSRRWAKSTAPRSAAASPPSAFRCGRRTPTCRWNCRPWWTSVTRTGGTTRWTTASRPNRRWIPRRRLGR